MTEEDTKAEAGNDTASDDWGSAMAEQASATASSGGAFQPEQLNAESQAGGALTDGNQNLELILDIPVVLSMEIGRTRIPIRNLLQLSQGSVVELDRLAGEPMDVMVNGTLIAQGEVVVINDKYGIRLTDIISPTERIKRLK